MKGRNNDSTHWFDTGIDCEDIAFVKHIRHIEPSVGEQVEMLLQRQWRILLISANNGLFGLCAVLTGQQQPMLSQSIQCGELR